MPQSLENTAVATGLKKVSFHFNPEERQCQSKFKLQHSCIHLQFSSVQSLSSILLFVTPWTIVSQAPLSKQFSRQEYWRRLPFPTPGDLLNPGIKLASPMSPALAGVFFTTSATWEAHTIC